nr:uncharacterized protein LOC111513283 [Leptinotarsa decemlineata]
MSTEKSVSLLQRVHWICNTIYHQLVAIVAVYVSYIFFKYINIDNRSLWHNFLCTTAYIPLMAEGFILFSEQNVWSQRLERKKKYYIHGILLAVSTISLSVGIGLKIDVKNQHFKSDHAITGLASWILALASVILGMFAAYSQSLKSFLKPVILKLIHNFLGMASFAIGIASLCLGLYYRDFAGRVTTIERDTTLWLVGIVSTWSVVNAIVSQFNQLRSLLSSN